MYHFLSGYTAKVAGTERGLSQDPSAVFSALLRCPVHDLAPESIRRPARGQDAATQRRSLALEHGVDRRRIRPGAPDRAPAYPSIGRRRPEWDDSQRLLRGRSDLRSRISADVPRRAQRKSSTHARPGPTRPPTTLRPPGSPNCSARISDGSTTSSLPSKPPAHDSDEFQHVLIQRIPGLAHLRPSDPTPK